MKTALATTLAAAMLAASSLAFAADNNTNNNNAATENADQTGSIKSGTDKPDQADIERCKMAQADDPTCVGVPKE